MLESEVPYTERELIQRAIDQAAQYGANCGHQRWVSVKRAFAVGSSVAVAICWKYGYDPESILGCVQEPDLECFRDEDPLT